MWAVYEKLSVCRRSLQMNEQNTRTDNAEYFIVHPIEYCDIKSNPDLHALEIREDGEYYHGRKIIVLDRLTSVP